ncbi:MAG: hypothetical protein ACK55I_10415, partial [bacterium]
HKHLAEGAALAAVHREHGGGAQGREGVAQEEKASPDLARVGRFGATGRCTQPLQGLIEGQAGGAADRRQQAQGEAIVVGVHTHHQRLDDVCLRLCPEEVPFPRVVLPQTSELQGVE